MTPNQEWVQQNGSALRLQRWPGAQPTLVLLHEGLGCLELWKGFPEAVNQSTGHAVLAYERPGHGCSGPLPTPRTPAFLEAERDRLFGMLDQLGVMRPILLGHSDGGTLALLAAAHHPERIAGVLTLAAHVHVDARTREGLQAAARAFQQGPLRAKLTAYHGAGTEALFHAWNQTWQAMPDWNMHADLASIQCPVVALQGSEDAYGEPGQLEAIRSRVSGPVQVQIIPACGHAPHREAPDVVMAALQGLLRQI